MESYELLLRLIQRSKEMDEYEYPMGKRDMSKTEFRLLREVLLEERSGRKIISSELARRLRVTRSAVSQIVSKLEEQNILQRIPSHEDKKIAYIGLSPQAKEILEERFMFMDLLIRKTIERYGEKRLERLISEFDELYTIRQGIKSELEERN